MTRVVLLILLSLVLCGSAIGQTSSPARVNVNGVELHYIEQGDGEPLILLHGGQGDYRSWATHLETLSRRYKVIAYSRRYNYPNNNPMTASYRSAYTDADDLAAFIQQLNLGPTHLVGTSAGALAALVLATERPDLVRSLVLAEPPIHRWAREDVKGKILYNEFMASIWQPAGHAFDAGNDQQAMSILVDGFAGPGKFDSLSPEARTLALQNSRFFRVATASADPFPSISKDKVRQLKMPVLIVTGENTIELHKFVNEELARLIPGAERAAIPNAGHGSPRENPRAFNDAVTTFLKNLNR